MPTRSRRLIAVPTPETVEDARSDDELMALVSAGSRDIFAVLVRRHWTRVRGLCTKLVGEVVAGEELAQEVWLDVWEARTEYREEGRFTAFLITLSRNRCNNWLRASRRRRRRHLEARRASVEVAASIDDAARTPDASEVLLKRERQHRMLSALARLEPAQREALVLRFHDLEAQNAWRVRIGSGVAMAAYGTVGTLALIDHQPKYAAFSYGFALIGGWGLMGLGMPDKAGALHDGFATSLARAKSPAERARVLFEVENAMQQQADAARNQRLWMRLPFGFGVAAATAFLVQSELDDGKTAVERNQDRALFSLTALYSGWALTSTFLPEPIERIVDLWKADPSQPKDDTASIPSLQLAIVPEPGGGVVGLLGTF
jgi:RNA polymerase sigma-70 factor, ECF subfamily